MLRLLTLALLSVAAAAQTLPSLQSARPLGQDLYIRSGSTGLVLVVVRGRETTIATLGETYPGSHQPPTSGSLLRLCSLTKIFTTDVLVKLIQAGGIAGEHPLRLDTPLQTLAPNHRRVPLHPGARPITLGDLATHTAGLPREIGSGPRDAPHFTYPGPVARWAWLATYRPRTAPGAAALYSNVSFDFLSDALQQSAGMPYPRLLAARTLNPLAMSNTTFTPSEAQCARLLLSAAPQGPCADTTNTAGSSGLYSTAADMARFLEYLLGAGSSANPSISFPRQDPAAQAVYIDPASLAGVSGLDHAGDPTGIGLGWIHLLPADSPSHIVEKTGGGAGFSTYIAINHARRTAIFVAATDGPIDTHQNLFKAANDLLLAVAGLPPLPPPPPKPTPKRRRVPQNRVPHPSSLGWAQPTRSTFYVLR